MHCFSPWNGYEGGWKSWLLDLGGTLLVLWGQGQALLGTNQRCSALWQRLVTPRIVTGRQQRLVEANGPGLGTLPERPLEESKGKESDRAEGIDRKGNAMTHRNLLLNDGTTQITNAKMSSTPNVITRTMSSSLQVHSQSFGVGITWRHGQWVNAYHSIPSCSWGSLCSG